MEVDNSDKDCGPPPGAQLFTLGEQEVKGVELNTVEEKPDSPFQRTTAAEAMCSAPGEKIEQMVDPLHAMLLDMLPLLGKKGTEDASRAPLTKVEKDPPAIGSSTSNSEILVPDAGTSGVPASDPNAAPPPKKKKVSYEATMFVWACLAYKPYFSSQRTIFFSQTKSANGTFNHGSQISPSEQGERAWSVGISCSLCFTLLLP